MGKSKIEWTDYTFNPWIGCTKVSAGCENCYAERDNRRYGWVKSGWGPKAQRHRTSEENWENVYRWNKGQWWECSICGTRWDDRYAMRDACGHVCPDDYEAAKRTRARVFCASLADVFEDRPDLAGWRKDLLRLIDETPHLDWMLLTKRPENVKPMVLEATGEWPVDWFAKHPYVWVGTSIESSQVARERLTALRGIPAGVRFVSCGPLVGRVSLLGAVEPWDEDWDEVNADPDDCEPEEFVEECEAECDWINYGNELVVNPEYREWVREREWQAHYMALKRTVDWVIVEGESGPHARIMKVEWVRELASECEMAEIPFFFKQWGEWLHESQLPIFDPSLKGREMAPVYRQVPVITTPKGEVYYRVGRGAGEYSGAGRLLDGEERRAWPVDCDSDKEGAYGEAK